jgi:hypothetical protein
MSRSDSQLEDEASRPNYSQQLSEALSAAVERLINEGWPYPITGGDKWITMGGEQYPGWHLASTLHDGHVFLVHDGDSAQLVRKPSQWSSEAVAFTERGVSYELTRDIVKRLQTIATVMFEELEIEDEDGQKKKIRGKPIPLTTLPTEKWGRQV